MRFANLNPKVASPIVFIALAIWLSLIIYWTTQTFNHFNFNPLIQIKVYFPNYQQRTDNNCYLTLPVKRQILGQNSYFEAVNLLLTGPNQKEKENGYFSVLNKPTTLQRVRLIKNTAYVDFKNLPFKNSDSCQRNLVREQIAKTLFQFPKIKSVLILVEGQVLTD